MFPQFKKLKQESGVVLFIVLMVAIIIMLFSAGILSQSLNERNYSQQQVDQIASEELAKGIFWNSYSTAFGSASYASMGSAGTVAAYNIADQGRNYQVQITSLGGNPPAYNAVVSYDTL
jgi:ABC-type Fe3+ transport system permease subunit